MVFDEAQEVGGNGGHSAAATMGARITAPHRWCGRAGRGVGGLGGRRGAPPRSRSSTNLPASLCGPGAPFYVTARAGGTLRRRRQRATPSALSPPARQPRPPTGRLPTPPPPRRRNRAVTGTPIGPGGMADVLGLLRVCGAAPFDSRPSDFQVRGY